jgi:hypothetical protein
LEQKWIERKKQLHQKKLNLRTVRKIVNERLLELMMGHVEE